ncbi:MAG: hypothetical protein OXC28_11405 [Defluviicoccus sp.]|nr:hypothetical protein [Defluviicoccus sp.]
MPILNSRIQGKALDEDGNEVSVSPSEALKTVGPRLEVLVSPLDEQVKVLVEHGQPVPGPVRGFALVDTGASITCIDRDVAVQAGLAVVDSGPMHSATHANEIVPIYAGRLMISGLCAVDANRAYGASLAPQGLVALVGRDILAQCQFTYNGVDGSFSIAI